MEDLLKCVSRAYGFALLYGYVGCFALLESGLVLVALKERFVGIFCPLERCFGAASIILGARLEREGGGAVA